MLFYTSIQCLPPKLYSRSKYRHYNGIKISQLKSFDDAIVVADVQTEGKGETLNR